VEGTNVTFNVTGQPALRPLFYHGRTHGTNLSVTTNSGLQSSPARKKGDAGQLHRLRSATRRRHRASARRAVLSVQFPLHLHHLGGLRGPGWAAPMARATPARFNNPYGTAVDNTGNVYVAERDNHTIRRITGQAGLRGRTLGPDLRACLASADGTWDRRAIPIPHRPWPWTARQTSCSRRRGPPRKSAKYPAAVVDDSGPGWPARPDYGRKRETSARFLIFPLLRRPRQRGQPYCARHPITTRSAGDNKPGLVTTLGRTAGRHWQHRRTRVPRQVFLPTHRLGQRWQPLPE